MGIPQTAVRAATAVIEDLGGSSRADGSSRREGASTTSPLPVRSPARSDRNPPNALDAERGVLGSVLTDPVVMAEALEVLPSPESFYDRRHRLIYGAMVRVYERGEAPDVVNVAAELERAGDLEEAGGSPT